MIEIGALCLGIAFAGGVYADIYRWTDETGKVHFSDQAPAGHSSEAVELRINTYKSVSYDTSVFEADKKVIMYSASWCGVCKKAKRYFQTQNIPYKEFDIEKSRKGRTEFRKLGAKGVPVILVGKKRMNGFTEKGFQKLYP